MYIMIIQTPVICGLYYNILVYQYTLHISLFVNVHFYLHCFYIRNNILNILLTFYFI